jgi:type II secretory pathway pseudopilin PulG
VELLVALVIAMLIAAAVVALYRITTRTVGDQQARARGPHAAGRVLDRLAEDVGRAVLNADSTGSAFTLYADAVSPVLSFWTLDPASETEPDWTLVRQVRYQLAGDPPALARIVQPLTGTGSLGPALTNIVAAGTESWTVSVFDGQAWQPTWPPPEAAGRRPQCLRIELSSTAWPVEGGRVKADLIIPAGLSLTSTVVRAVAGPDGAPASSP